MCPFLEGYESANAREWDDSPKKPIATVAHRSSTSFPSPALIPSGPVVENAIQMPATLQHNRPGQHEASKRTALLGRGRSGQLSSQPLAEKLESKYPENSRPGKKWARVDLITTQKQVDNTKKEKRIAEDNQFLKQPRDYDFSTTSHHLWLDKDTHLSEILDGENLNRLHDIRKQCKVFIKLDVTSECIQVFSKSWESNDKALSQIKVAIRSARAEIEGLSKLIVVEPPSGTAMKTAVIPQFKHVRDTSHQPVINKVRLYGSKLTAGEAYTWEEKRKQLMKQNKERICEHLHQKFRKLSGLQCGMRMRVHMGHMELHRYQKRFSNTTYSVQRFMEMISSSETNARLEKNLGDVLFALKIKSHIEQFPDMFSPADSITSTMAEIKTRHNLIVSAQTPSKEHIRIEADFDELTEKNEWHIGPTTCYKSTGRKPRLEVGMLSFESVFDWSMEVLTNEIISETPENLKLTRSFNNPVQRKDQFGLLYPSVQLLPHPNIRIHETCVRSVEQYRLTGTPYILEAAIYRRWNGGDTTIDPSAAYGLTLYNKEWDILMSPTKHTRDLGSEVCDFFPGSNFAIGLSDFLDHIQKVRQILNHGV